MEYYFKRYGDLELQRRMVSDRRRTEAFRAALEATVRKNDVVLDVGTGTGILAMLAARFGAARVYAIDQSPIAQAAANLVKANGLSRKVKILRGLAADLTLEEPVDLLVSEWLGHLGFVEGMLDDVLAARDRNLRKGGRMIPSGVSAMLAPIDDAVLFGADGPGFWRNELAGLDLTPLEKMELDQGRAIQIRVEPSALLAPGHPIAHLPDLRRASLEDPWNEGAFQFTPSRDGVLNGFVGWFVAELAPGVTLDTGPHFQETHWSQTYLPFPPRIVRRSRAIRVRYALYRDPEERRHVRLDLAVGREAQHYVIE